MLFNSIEFALFLPIVFALYWFIVHKNLQLQNTLLLLASYVFYGWWDWRFLALIIFSSSADYIVALLMAKETSGKRRKWLLITSISVNLGFLMFFKYFNFFAESFSDAFTLLGKPFEATRLNIILPVGISFYTFQTMSYTIDVYRRKIEPTKDILSFFAFVGFFPQLVAGPIERASDLLPQFYKKRVLQYEEAFDGFKQILWGLFKKVVVADGSALIVNEVFSNHTEYGSSTLALGVFLFAFQIYADFSGYSDMAIGTARLFGFNLMRNFALPYFSRDMAEFWRRWHISLNTWFRDYLYIPLGGSKGGKWINTRNVFIIFIVSGFWHGVIIWGALNAFYFLPLLLTNRNRRHTDSVAPNRIFPSVKELFQMGSTFALTTFSWIFFRADSLPIAISYISQLFSPSLFSIPYVFGIGLSNTVIIVAFIIILVTVEWFSRNKAHPLELSEKYSEMVQWSVCYGIVIVVFLFGRSQQDFIYFQF
jgi:alginate O-acetyltransferase complex protein AlgI